MTWNGTYLEFKRDKYSNIRDWQFIAYEEVLPSIVEAKAPTCASTAATIVSGWERVTTKEQLTQNPERYFYAIFSAVNPGVMMTTEYNDNAYRMCYKAAGNPLSSATYDLFEIENYDGEFAIKSNITGEYYGNTSGAPWNFIANQETLNEACKVTVTCSNEVFNLQDKYADGNAATDPYVGNYLGAWDNMEFTGERLAGNKSLLRAGYFLIYRIAKENLDMTGRITNPSFEAEDINAWSCTTGNDTGRKENSGNYSMSNVAGSYLFNTWNNNNASEVSQTLSNMPSGFYTLTAVMASDNNETLRLKIGEDVIATSIATGKNDGIETSGSFSFPGGNMVIKADANDHWYKADNFRLTYLGGMEAKADLLSTINDANTLYNSGANVGSGVFQIPTAAGTTFSNAIATAQGVYDNASSTYEEVLSANSTLQTAITTYEGVTLNAPTVGTRYKLTLADRGTLTYQTASTEGGYGMPFKAAGDYMAQTFTFTQVSGNTYTMSFEDFDGNTRYICTRAQYGSGGTGTYGIRSFVAGEGGKTALHITIQATSTANVFNMLNTECDNKKLGSNGGDFYTDNAYTSWSIAEATQAEVTVSCKAGKYGTVIFPFTPDVSEGFVGITFYSCEDINTTTNNVLIESVDEPQANTPYIIKNANGSNFSTILTGWGTSATTEHTAGLLTGIYTDDNIPMSDASNSYYVLQTKDDVQAFYKVEDADFPGTPYKCYLTIPAATPVKAFLFPENPTAINAIETAENENTEIYNLAGQRLSKAQKGVNIVNGKKVLVK